MKPHLIMPMGGSGSRFSKEGFDLPKPLIPLFGEPFFYWATQSVVKFCPIQDVIFVVLKDHILRYGIDKEIKKRYPEAKLIVLDHVLNGALFTCLEGLKIINDDSPIIINDCDHLFKSSELNLYIGNESVKSSKCGGLVVFKSNLPQFSYVRYNSRKKVIGTIEKKVESNDAICGAYFFSNKSVFLDAANLYLKDCVYKEFFLSGLYNELIKDNIPVKIFQTDFHVSFGTPEEFACAKTDRHHEELL